MKPTILILALALSQSFAFAAPQPTPVSGRLIAKTPMDKLTIRLRQQNIQISRDLKAGKLTAAQAKTLKGQVEAIRKAEIADIKENGTNEYKKGPGLQITLNEGEKAGGVDKWFAKLFLRYKL